MSSRREEKDRAKAERIAAEEALAAKEGRRRMLGIAVGAVLVVAAVVAVVIAVTSGSKKEDGGSSTTATTEIPKVAIPPPKVRDLQAAAKAAGCKLHTFAPGPNDREHVTRKVTYKQNPPVFGPHFPVPASDGSYAGRPAPPTEQTVHALEHGRIAIQYRPGTDPRKLGQLETLLNESPKPGLAPGYNTLLFENQTKMPYEVAATAWGQQLVCQKLNDRVFDAIRDFRTAYVDKGPELIPQPE
jgi:hypothetical protein